MGNQNYGSHSDFQSLCIMKFRIRKEYNRKELSLYLGKAVDTVDAYFGTKLPIYADLARAFKKGAEISSHFNKA